MLSRRVTSWLTALSDPTGPPTALPAQRLRDDQIAHLCDFAHGHGVLPAVVANLKETIQQSGLWRVVAGADEHSVRRRLATALAAAQRHVTTRTTLSLVLRRQLGEIAAALAQRSLPAVVIKGPEFADRLYPLPAYRPFTDLDLLVDRQVMTDVQAVMQSLGYRRKEEPGRKHTEDYGQDSWLRRESDRPGGTVEIHWNLVNSPTIRTGVSIQYNDLQLETGLAGGKGTSEGLTCRASPASLLLIAAVHGATSHQFDRLALLWDVCQAVRGAAGAIDEDWLAQAVRRTGSQRAMAMALHLGRAALAEPKCDRLRQRMRWPGPSLVDRVSLNRSVVIGRRAAFVRARRLTFRQRLKRR